MFEARFLFPLAVMFVTVALIVIPGVFYFRALRRRTSIIQTWALDRGFNFVERSAVQPGFLPGFLHGCYLLDNHQGMSLSNICRGAYAGGEIYLADYFRREASKTGAGSVIEQALQVAIHRPGCQVPSFLIAKEASAGLKSVYAPRSHWQFSKEFAPFLGPFVLLAEKPEAVLSHLGPEFRKAFRSLPKKNMIIEACGETVLIHMNLLRSRRYQPNKLPLHAEELNNLIDSANNLFTVTSKRNC